MKKVFVCFSSFVPSTSYWTTYPKQIQSSKTKKPSSKKKKKNHGKSVYLQFNERLRRQGELFKKCDFLKEEEENLNEEVWMNTFVQTGFSFVFWRIQLILYAETASMQIKGYQSSCSLETIFIGILAPFMEKEQFKTFNRFNLLKESSNEGELIFDSIFFFFREIVFQDGKESVEKCLFHLISLFFFAPFFCLQQSLNFLRTIKCITMTSQNIAKKKYSSNFLSSWPRKLSQWALKSDIFCN